MPLRVFNLALEKNYEITLIRSDLVSMYGTFRMQRKVEFRRWK